jgi:hypothetical protein
MVNVKAFMEEIVGNPGQVIEANFRPTEPATPDPKPVPTAQAADGETIETAYDDETFRTERAKIQGACRWHFKGRPQVEAEALRQIRHRLSHCHDCGRPLGLTHYVERAGVCFCFACFEKVQQLPSVVEANTPNREGMRVFHHSAGIFTEGRLPLAKFPRPDKIKCGKCKGELGSGHGLYIDPASKPQNYRIICVDCGKQSREVEGLVFAWVDDVFVEKAPRVGKKKTANDDDDNEQHGLF